MSYAITSKDALTCTKWISPIKCLCFEVKPCDSALKSKGFYFGAKVILRLDFLSSATDSVRPQTELFCERTLTVAFHICAFALFSTLIYLQIFTLNSI